MATSVCYCLGNCFALVSRIYKLTCEEASLEIRTILRQRFLFFGGTTVNFEVKHFFNDKTEGVLTDTLINFQDTFT